MIFLMMQAARAIKIACDNHIKAKIVPCKSALSENILFQILGFIDLVQKISIIPHGRFFVLLYIPLPPRNSSLASNTLLSCGYTSDFLLARVNHAIF